MLRRLKAAQRLSREVAVVLRLAQAVEHISRHLLGSAAIDEGGY